MTHRTGDEIPLARLFAIAYRELVDGLHDELRRRGWTDVRPAFGFVLLALRDRPRTATQLAATLGTSKQATSKLVEAMQNAGYLRSADAPDGRQRPVELTDRGLTLLDAVEDIYAVLERRWAELLGSDAVDRLRRDLVTVLTSPDTGRLPIVRPPA
ncbi:MAG TPA: MarR family winged helix-turn-helix transcriptional regulator [Microlunatus sp.]|nr:MarR family winged helix-turn-helix transcriptional regulator [Microlunatus sp.]